MGALFLPRTLPARLTPAHPGPSPFTLRPPRRGVPCGRPLPPAHPARPPYPRPPWPSPFTLRPPRGGAPCGRPLPPARPFARPPYPRPPWPPLHSPSGLLVGAPLVGALSSPRSPIRPPALPPPTLAPLHSPSGLLVGASLVGALFLPLAHSPARLTPAHPGPSPFTLRPPRRGAPRGRPVLSPFALRELEGRTGAPRPNPRRLSQRVPLASQTVPFPVPDRPIPPNRRPTPLPSPRLHRDEMGRFGTEIGGPPPAPYAPGAGLPAPRRPHARRRRAPRLPP